MERNTKNVKEVILAHRTAVDTLKKNIQKQFESLNSTNEESSARFYFYKNKIYKNIQDENIQDENRQKIRICSS